MTQKIADKNIPTAEAILPSPKHVRELLQEVQNCASLNFIVIKNEGPLRYRAHTRQEIQDKVSNERAPITTPGRWLAHRLIHACVLPEVRKLREEKLADIGLTLRIYDSLSRKPASILMLSPDQVNKLANIFSQGDSELKSHLIAAFTQAPIIGTEKFRNKHLKREVPKPVEELTPQTLERLLSSAEIQIARQAEAIRQAEIARQAQAVRQTEIARKAKQKALQIDLGGITEAIKILGNSLAWDRESNSNIYRHSLLGHGYIAPVGATYNNPRETLSTNTVGYLYALHDVLPKWGEELVIRRHHARIMADQSIGWQDMEQEPIGEIGSITIGGLSAKIDTLIKDLVKFYGQTTEANAHTKQNMPQYAVLLPATWWKIQAVFRALKIDDISHIRENFSNVGYDISAKMLADLDNGASDIVEHPLQMLKFIEACDAVIVHHYNAYKEIVADPEQFGSPYLVNIDALRQDIKNISAKLTPRIGSTQPSSLVR